MKFPQLFLLGLAACMLYALTARAQDSCATAVARATKSYDLGNLSEVVSIITPCLNDLSRDDQWQAYRLLALAYLFQDEPVKADDAIYNMLLVNPAYERNPDRDPYEFLQAMQRYDAGPGLSLVAHCGATTASTEVLRYHSLRPVTAAASYSGSLALAFGIGLEYHLSRDFSVMAQGMMVTSALTRTSGSAIGLTTSYSEHLSYLTIPVTARFAFAAGTVTPFLTAGGYVQVLPYATASIASTDSLHGTTKSQSDIFSSTRRRFFAIGLIIGAGATYPLGSNGQLAFTVRYLNGLSDVTLASQRYANSDLLYGYSYIDDDFALRNIEISVGYAYHLTFRTYRNEEGQ